MNELTAPNNGAVDTTELGAEDLELGAVAGDAENAGTVLAGGRALVMGFWGWDGSGKTLSACMMAHQYREQGYQILHNGCLKFGELVRLDLMVDLKYRDAFILIDEAQSAFDSRRAMTLLNVEASNFLAQRRKQNVHLAWTSPYPGQLEKRLYIQTNFTIRCYTNDEGHNIHWTITDDHGHHSYPGSRLTGLFYNAKRFWNMYDSGSTQPLHHNKIDSRQQAEMRRMERVNVVLAAVLSMAEAGIKEATPLQIYQTLITAGQATFSADTIGRVLSAVGFTARLSHGRRLYPITEIAQGITGSTGVNGDGLFESAMTGHDNAGEPVDLSELSGTMGVQDSKETGQELQPSALKTEDEMLKADALFALVGPLGADLEDFGALWVADGLDAPALLGEIQLRGFKMSASGDGFFRGEAT